MDVKSVEEFDKKMEENQHPTLIVIVAAEWCGACKRLEETVWKPFCNQKEAPPNVIRISDEEFPNTKLGQKTPIQYYPTVLEVTSSGTGEQVATPVKTPRSVEELRSLAGVSSASAEAVEAMDSDRIPNANLRPMQKGGSFLQTLHQTAHGVLPAAVIGTLALYMQSGGKGTRSKTRKSNRGKRKTSNRRRRKTRRGYMFRA